MNFFKKPIEDQNYLALAKDITIRNIYKQPFTHYPYGMYDRVRNKNSWNMGAGTRTMSKLQALFMNIQQGRDMTFSEILSQISTTERIKANNYIQQILDYLRKTNEDLTSPQKWQVIRRSIQNTREGSSSLHNFPRAESGTTAIIAMMYARFIEEEMTPKDQKGNAITNTELSETEKTEKLGKFFPTSSVTATQVAVVHT